MSGNSRACAGTSHPQRVRESRRAHVSISAILLAAVALSAIAVGCDRTATSPAPPDGSGPDPSSVQSAVLPALDLAPEGPVQRAAVVRIVDGDTIIVDRGLGNERVRYIGIDTPESVIPDRTPEPFGPEATSANEALLAGGVVFLERDVSETDRFGRLLRYVWVRDGADPSRWTMVNRALVAAGWATVTTFPPDVRHADLFVAVQRAARDASLGIWAPRPPSAP